MGRTSFNTSPLFWRLPRYSPPGSGAFGKVSVKTFVSLATVKNPPGKITEPSAKVKSAPSIRQFDKSNATPGCVLCNSTKPPLAFVAW